MLGDTHNMSNVSAARDPQDPQPAVVIEREVFDAPNVVSRDNANYVDQLASINTARAAAAPAGAPAGAYDDGGVGGPDFLSGAGNEDQEKRQKEIQEAGAKAAESVTVQQNDLSAYTSPTMVPENQPTEARLAVTGGGATADANEDAPQSATTRKRTTKKSTSKKSS
jgi:hypothetical protein